MFRSALVASRSLLARPAASSVRPAASAHKLPFSTTRPSFADPSSSSSQSTSEQSDLASSSPSPILNSSEVSASQEAPAATPSSASTTPFELPGSVLPNSESGSASSRAASPVEYSLTPDRAPFYLHIRTSTNNTLLTLTNGKGNTLYACSGGSVGFKGAARSGYEAGYQAALNMFSVIGERHRTVWPNQKNGGTMFKLELVWKGFGRGRDAVSRALLADEGTMVRQYVSRMSDATKLKIGGVRAKKQRNY
ncbi:unnamed protein product [Parajaminaea phylloscopi]